MYDFLKLPKRGRSVDFSDCRNSYLTSISLDLETLSSESTIFYHIHLEGAGDLVMLLGQFVFISLWSRLMWQIPLHYNYGIANPLVKIPSCDRMFSIYTWIAYSCQLCKHISLRVQIWNILFSAREFLYFNSLYETSSAAQLSISTQISPIST